MLLLLLLLSLRFQPIFDVFLQVAAASVTRHTLKRRDCTLALFKRQAEMQRGLRFKMDRGVGLNMHRGVKFMLTHIDIDCSRLTTSCAVAAADSALDRG